MLTKNEIDLLGLALFWHVRYEESNPDVGMGPSHEMMLERVLKQAPENTHYRMRDDDKRHAIDYCRKLESKDNR